MYGSSRSRGAFDSEQGRYVVRPLVHSSNAKSRGIAGNNEACSIVLDDHLHRGPAIPNRDRQLRASSVENRIRNRLITDSQQSVGNAQREILRGSFAERSDLYGGALRYHPLSTFLECRQQPNRLQVLGAQRRNAAARFFMTVTNHALREFELWKNIDPVADIVVNCLQLEAQAREALCQRIMHFMSQALPLFKDGLHPPSLHKEKPCHPCNGESQYAHDNFNDVGRTPPGRAFHNFNVARRWQN